MTKIKWLIVGCGLLISPRLYADFGIDRVNATGTSGSGGAADGTGGWTAGSTQTVTGLAVGIATDNFINAGAAGGNVGMVIATNTWFSQRVGMGATDEAGFTGARLRIKHDLTYGLRIMSTGAKAFALTNGGVDSIQMSGTGDVDTQASMASSTHSWTLQNTDSTGGSSFGHYRYNSAASRYMFGQDPVTDVGYIFTDGAWTNGWRLYMTDWYSPALSVTQQKYVGVNTLTPLAQFEVKSGTTGINYVLRVSSQNGAAMSGVTADGRYNLRGSTYTLPNGYGTAGQVWTTDGAGTINWGTVTSTITGSGGGNASGWAYTNSIATSGFTLSVGTDVAIAGSNVVVSTPGTSTTVQWVTGTTGHTNGDGVSLTLDANGFDINQRESRYIRFLTGGVERMRFASGGTIGIGTVNTIYGLEISSKTIFVGGTGAALTIIGEVIASTVTSPYIQGSGTGTMNIVSSSTRMDVGVNGDTATLKIYVDTVTINDQEVVTVSAVQTLTNKTYDAAATGNVLKQSTKDLWTNADYITTSTNAYSNVASTYPFYNQAKFDAGVATTTNKVYLRWFSGPDFNTGVLPTCVFSDMKDAVDTSTRGYIVSIASVSAGDVLSTLTFGNINRVKVSNTAVGGQGASGISATTNLTGWDSFIAASTQYIIQIAREGDSAVMDPSTVASYFNEFYLMYGTTQ